VLLNPLVVITVLVLLISAGWLAYTGRMGSFAQPRPGANLLPALFPALAEPAATPGPSPSAGTSVAPSGGWTAGNSGDAKTSLGLVPGQLGGQALKLDITQYVSGDVTLTSPRVDLVPGKTYLFKAFTTTNPDFRLLARKYHKDGSATLEQLRNPLERAGTSPFTVSDAFNSGDTTTAVQYVFRFASAGTFQMEGVYLEAADDVQVPPAAASGPNVIPNPGFAGTQPQQPAYWSPYSSGALAVESGRGEDGRGSFLWTRIGNYQNGEAKWQYQPVPVTADRYFTFGAAYKSDRQVDVVAEFELAAGGRRFRNLETVPPAGDWTTISEAFQVPDGAVTALVTLIAHGNGTTAVRDFSLIDATRPGPLRWKAPMVSITFDDGWQSVYDRALPLLDKHGFRSTQYVTPSSIETPNFLTAAEIQQLNQAGHEIAAQSFQHVDLTSLGTDRLDEELRKSEDALAAAGLPTDNLAPPYGRSDPQVDWYAAKYFKMVRGTGDGINTRQNINPRDLKILYVTDATTPEALKEALAETARSNGWLILVYHQIAAPGSPGTQKNSIAADRSTITSDVLATQLQLIDDSGIQVKPVAQAFEQLQGP
jgi:peptidoglycan/xylan/chitin deacetylase (PgdA/CDA1 family)